VVGPTLPMVLCLGFSFLLKWVLFALPLGFWEYSTCMLIFLVFVANTHAP
jgi:hypothetical protein